MLRGIVGGLAAVLMAAGLLRLRGAGQRRLPDGGPVISKCDEPLQPDGTWQRCVATPH